MSRKSELCNLWSSMQSPEGLNALDPATIEAKVNCVWRTCEPSAPVGIMGALHPPDHLNGLDEDTIALAGVAYAARRFVNYVSNGDIYVSCLDPSMEPIDDVIKSVSYFEVIDGTRHAKGTSYRFSAELRIPDWLELLSLSQRSYDTFFERASFAVKANEVLPESVRHILSYYLGGLLNHLRPSSPKVRVEHRDTLLRHVSKRVSLATKLPQSWNTTTKINLAGQERPVRTSLICCAALAGLGVKISPDAAGTIVQRGGIGEETGAKLERFLVTYGGPLTPEGENSVVNALAYGRQITFDVEAALDTLLTPFQSH